MTFEELIGTNKNIIIICINYRDAKYQLDNLVAKKNNLIHKVSRVSNRVDMVNGTVITFIPEYSYQKLLGISNDTPMFHRSHFQPLVDGCDKDLVRIMRT